MVEKSVFEDIKMYVALKLEDASDAEIQEAMGIGHQKLRNLEQDFYTKARELTATFSNNTSSSTPPVGAKIFSL